MQRRPASDGARRQSQTPAAYLDKTEQQVYGEWMAWARAHARRLDPLADGLLIDAMSPQPLLADSNDGAT